MKVFVSPKFPNRMVSDNYYNLCPEGELLTFSIPQLLEPNNTKSHYRDMVGINSLNKTTEIAIMDLRISKEFYMELLGESYMNAYPEANISLNGNIMNLSICIKDCKTEYEFDLVDLAEMLLSKASEFQVGDNLNVKGKNFIKKI